jgi:beta-glucosidase
VQDGDLHEMAAPIDFLGVNFYQPAVAEPGDGPLAVEEVHIDGPRTAMGWAVEPTSLTSLLLRLRRDYGDIPLVITENGASFEDPPVDGHAVVEDPERVSYLRDHIAAVELAVEPGSRSSARARSASATVSSTTSTRWIATSRWSSRATRSTRT